MKTFVYLLDLKDDPKAIREYREYHQAVWPQVKASLLNVGIIHMRIYLLGRRLVNIVDTTDDFVPEIGFARYAENNPIVQKWDALMATYQVKVPSAKEDEWWALTEKVFELERDCSI